MTRKKAAFIFALANAAIILASLAYVLVFYNENAPAVCKFKEILHMYCPGCGGTRAVYYLLRFNPVRSFISNPVVIVTALILADIDVRCVVAIVKNDEQIFTRFNPKVFFIVPAVLVFNFVLRNLLLYGFSIDLLGDFIA